MNSRSKSQAKYDAKATKRYGLKLNIKYDNDVIEKLESVENIQGYIKALIRKDMETSNSTEGKE